MKGIKLISNNDYILKLLNIEDKKIKGKKYQIIRGILTYTPSFCPCCGVIPHRNNDIYKNNNKYIENLFKYEINNGIIEGNNNLVKTIKRIAF